MKQTLAHGIIPTMNYTMYHHILEDAKHSGKPEEVVARLETLNCKRENGTWVDNSRKLY